MSRPPLNPDKTAAGIAVDPHTLERVIPESKRPDGTVRKQIKIRPGFTPQEDVRRFRSTKAAQMDANALPKGHIIGWAPPPQSTTASGSDAKPLSKSAKKNAKRREKKVEKKDIQDNWDDDEDDDGGSVTSTAKRDTTGESQQTKTSSGNTQDKPNWAAASGPDPTAAPSDRSPELDELMSKVGKLDIK